MKIAIASDHAGYELKRQLKEFFVKINFIDVGTFSEESVDYPDYAHKAIEQYNHCLLYTSPSPRDGCRSRMPSSA